MEQKIAGCWIDPDNMDTEKLEQWRRVCHEAVGRAEADLGVIDERIRAKHLSDTAMAAEIAHVGYPE